MRVEATGVGHHFGGRRVFGRLDVQVEAGALVAVTGPSGSGKSTLLAVLSGLLRPIEGDVTVIDDRGVRTAASPSLVSWIPQGNNLLPARTVIDNVALSGLALGVQRATTFAAAAAALVAVGLEDRAATPAKLLSGGEVQRVAIARALVASRPMVFADEPTGNLDGHSSEVIFGLLRDAACSGQLVFVASHDRRLLQFSDMQIDLGEAA